jgi:hypothetical protein
VLLDNQFDPTALRFDSEKDALDFAAKAVQDGKDWASIYDVDAIKRYKDGELQIVIEIMDSRPNGKEFHLILCAIPDVRLGDAAEPAQRTYRYSMPYRPGTNGDDSFVLICDSYFVKCPEEIIPSLVRLEPAKQRLNLWRDVFGPTDRFGHQVVQTTGEGESTISGVWGAGSDRDRVASIVEGVSEILNEVGGPIGDGRREGLSQSDLVDLMAWDYSVRLDNSLVSLDMGEVDNVPLKFGEVYLSQFKLLPRTSQQTGTHSTE